jgi:hypothetical protein
MHALIKIAQNIDIFVCDFVDSMKVAQQEFYDSIVTHMLENPTFNDFNAIETLTNNLPMDWFDNLNGSEDDVYLAFLFFDHKYLIYYTSEDGSTSPQPITKEAFKRVVNKVKEECEGTARGLMFELEKCFLEHEVMIAFGVIYP